MISVEGSGFASGERIEVLYDNAIEEVGRADSGGEFTIRMVVPSDAGIGTTNKVKVQVRNQLDINASADHKTPGSMITLPETAQVGTPDNRLRHQLRALHDPERGDHRRHGRPAFAGP